MSLQLELNKAELDAIKNKRELTDTERNLIELKHAHQVVQDNELDKLSKFEQLRDKVYGSKYDDILIKISEEKIRIDEITKARSDAGIARVRASEAEFNTESELKKLQEEIMDSHTDPGKLEDLNIMLEGYNLAIEDGVRNALIYSGQLNNVTEEINKETAALDNLFFFQTKEKKAIEEKIKALEDEQKTLNAKLKSEKENLDMFSATHDGIREEIKVLEDSIASKDSNIEKHQELTAQLKVQSERTKEAYETYDEMAVSIENAEDTILKLEDELRKLNKQLHNTSLRTRAIEGFGDVFDVDLGLDFDFNAMFDPMLTAYTDSIDRGFEHNQAMKDMMLEGTLMLAEQAMAQAEAVIEARMQMFREAANQQKQINAEQFQDEVKKLKDSRAFQRMNFKSQQEAEKKLADARDEADKQADAKLKAALKAEFEKKQDMARIGALLNTAEAVTKALSSASPPASYVLAGIAAAMGAIQLAVINSQQPPKAELGGLIGGRRHSQGGTLIEAEQGEFIMRRDAVEAIGIENMNRINQGEGINNITVNFSGNVLSNDFIVEEAIPMIRDAVRRGEDIGIG